MDLKDKVVVITGASQGLGKTLSLKLSMEGAKVALVARSKPLLESVKSEVVRNQGGAEIFVCDIRNLSEVKETIQAIFKEFGSIDILINNAGVWTDEEIEKEHPEKRKEAFETNALGNIQFTEEILPFFKKKDAGYIFNVISTSAVADIPEGDNRFWKAYGASKWALAGFTKALRESLVGTKIKVTGFFPGGFESNLYETGQRKDSHNQPWMMKTEDVADIVIFALKRPTDVLMERIIVTKVPQ